MSALPTAPLRYSPSVEQPEPDEAETARGIVETLLKINEITWKDMGHAIRAVHAKSHGLLQGEMEVLDGLPSALAQGMFAKPACYPVVMRLSTVPGDILDDAVSTPRGLAVKIVGVEGERLPGSEGHATQDLVMVNGKAFGAPTAKAFLGNLKLVAATTDRAEGLKKVVSAVFRGIEHLVEAAGSESGLLKALGGHPETNILGESFYSQVPLRYGDYVAKLGIFPVSAGLMALTNASVDLDGHPNGIRDAVVAYFATHGGEWEVRVQLCTDLESMPVENAAAVWPEDKSPYVTVARITAPPQNAWSDARAEAVDDGMAFSPWHGLLAHQPLGSIMRVRKAAYEASSGFRAAHNKRATAEPSGTVLLPS